VPKLSKSKGFISTLIAEKPEYELEIYRFMLTQNPVKTPSAGNDYLGEIVAAGFSRALAAAPISDEAASLIIETQHKALLKLLAKNPNTSDEVKVQMSLLGYKPEKNALVTEELSMDKDPTSLVFPFSTLWVSSRESMGEMSGTEVVLPDVATYLYSIGHPYSMLDTKSAVANPIITEDALLWMIKREYLHRIFWRELTELEDEFDIAYVYKGRTKILFVDHPVLSPDFRYADAEDEVEPDLAGAIFDLPERPWTTVAQSLELDYAADEVAGRSDGNLVDKASENDLSSTYEIALAFLTYGNYGDRDSEKYGVSLTKQGQDKLLEAAERTIEYDMHDIKVNINLDFKENLSWKNLQHEKQIQLFSLLKTGLISTNEELSGTAEHFLGCMALHPNTPEDILSELGELGNELIQEVLDSR
jgi:hypothetical protein